MQRWLRRAFFVAAGFALVMALLPRPPAVPLNPGDKVQHMMAFATLGALAAAGWRRSSAVAIVGVLAMLGASIEIVQMIPALGRDAQWSDWFADGAATIAGVGIVRAFLPRR